MQYGIKMILSNELLDLLLILEVTMESWLLVTNSKKYPMVNSNISDCLEGNRLANVELTWT